MSVPFVLLYRNVHFLVFPFVHIHIEAGIGTALGFHIGESFGNGGVYKERDVSGTVRFFFHCYVRQHLLHHCLAIHQQRLQCNGM